jgi:NAD-dependent SIR2 family protein deacetylase
MCGKEVNGTMKQSPNKPQKETPLCPECNHMLRERVAWLDDDQDFICPGCGLLFSSEDLNITPSERTNLDDFI